MCWGRQPGGLCPAAAGQHALRASARRLLQALGDPQVLRSIGLTFQASALATGLAFVTGVPLAYLLARIGFAGKRLVETIIDLPVVIPHTAAGIALLMVFGSHGLLGQWLSPLGVTSRTTWAASSWRCCSSACPYLVNMSREAFAMMDRELEKTGSSRGPPPGRHPAHLLCRSPGGVWWEGRL